MTAKIAGERADRESAERRKRIEAERRRQPESEVWLGLVESAIEAAELPAWAGLEPRLPSAREPDAPLLHDAFVAVDRRAARRWVRRVLKSAAASTEPGAASLAALRGRTVDPLAFIAAAASQDGETLIGLAERAGADAAAVVAVAQLAGIPLLHGCGRALAARLPAGWRHGYCPVCGGWPGLAELRGLERTRVLRCGRCTAGWELPVLVCPFCGERDHANQLSLTVDGEDRRRVDACRSCHGYVKTTTTLAPLAPWAVPLDDLATLELDLAARERGFRGPETPGFAADVHVVAAAGPLDRLRGGWA